MTACLLAPALLPAQENPAPSSNGLWHGQVRSLRYHPEGEDFVIVNGDRRFNRALYGTNTAFRVEAGDLPEFALYMPGMGGNLQFTMLRGEKERAKPLIRAGSIRAIYRPGSMLYEIRDTLLGHGILYIKVLALAGEEGMIAKVRSENLPADTRLLTAFGGASGKKFSRDGDIGADPESSFYLKPEDCKDNRYQIASNRFHLTYGSGKSLDGIFPAGFGLSVSPDRILTDTLSLHPGRDYYFLIRNSGGGGDDLPALFAQAEKERAQIANRVTVNTPDPFINTLGGALGIAADAIWEDPSYLHGAVAWRMRLNAWRGPYAADPLGWHDRAHEHFASYALSQLTTPETGPVVSDTALHLARQLEKLGTSLFSSGYICRNPGGDFRPHHYDMNLVFIDELLDHFCWTGDTAFVRQMWPVIKRHLAWEKRNFDADGDGLYDAYCCIWASDALQYSGGGVTHSSAYNYRANATAAELAGLLGDDPTPYRQEADHILRAINTKLWMPDKGWWAEYIDRTPAQSPDRAGTSTLHPSAGLWTIYHAIDSKVPDAFQAWQALRYIDTEIPHIPIHAKGLTDTTLYMLSTTNWLPYTWSVNNVAMAEVLHTSLAYWQGHRPEDAFRLWKSALVESMYLGASPGNFQQLSFYDAIRGELYRDFADPIGMAARSLVEGLFGIHPDALHDTLTVEPGWPAKWDHASLRVPDIFLNYSKTANTDRYTITPSFPTKMNLHFRVRARLDQVQSVLVNDRPVTWRVVTGSVGSPAMEWVAPFAKTYRIIITWKGKPFHMPVISGSGNKTSFEYVRQGAFPWWEPAPIRAAGVLSVAIAISNPPGTRFDTISLSSRFNDRVTNIFRNEYRTPRPATPTLELPWQGIGNWCYPLVTAEIDDSGLRAKAGMGNEFVLANGMPLATPGIHGAPNIIFTSRWDNYPDSVSISLHGRSPHAYFLVAGTTNPMQSRITNGTITIKYKDGSEDMLRLDNPTNWWPIEQEYYEDGYAFSTGAPRPLRVSLKTGEASWKPFPVHTIKGFTSTAIDGGAATVLDLALHLDRELESAVLRATANDVVIGLMSLTLIRN